MRRNCRTTLLRAFGWSGTSIRATRTAAVYTSPEQCTVFDENGVLTGGDVLPGFELPLRELFAEIEGKQP